jgi:hypothetical protein
VEAIICNSGSIKYIISWENLGSTTKLSFTKLADPPPSTRSNSSNYNSRVYVCGGEYSVRFHSHPNCRGLNNCQSEVYYEDSEQDAVNNGYSYCNICWH